MTKAIAVCFFFHPDCTVGSGITPDHTFRLAGYTAGREFHPALKNKTIQLWLYYNPFFRFVKGKILFVSFFGKNCTGRGVLLWGFVKLFCFSGERMRLLFLFLLGATQTCFFPGLRGPNLRSLSARAERDKMAQATFSCPFRAIHLGHAKGEGVPIRLPLWKPHPHRPGRGLRPLAWTHPRGAEHSCKR